MKIAIRLSCKQKMLRTPQRPEEKKRKIHQKRMIYLMTKRKARLQVKQRNHHAQKKTPLSHKVEIQGEKE